MPDAPPPATDAIGLAALEARLRDDLLLLNLPARPWVPQREPDLLDVLIVGGGLNGLTAAAAATLLGLRVLVLDRAPEGQEGPWITTARMRTLRTPRDLAGPALSLPALTCRAWFEAQHGRAAWEAMERIPRAVWMDYLVWYRRVLDLPVRNGVEVTLVRPQGDAPVLVETAAHGTFRARRVILANGIDGLGGPAVPPAVARLDRRFWAHSSDAIDMAALRGKRVGVVGAGASAMDNAASALEAGAARVDLLIRRAEMPRTDKFTGSASKGMTLGFLDLPPEDKWRFFRIANAVQLPAPRQSVLRVSRHAHARFHFASPILRAEPDRGALRVVTPRGALRLDFLILATGFAIAPETRPELAAIAPHIRSWADSYTPPESEADEGLAASPDLGPGFEFRERVPGACPGLERIHCFAFPAVLTHGKMTSGVPAVSDGARRMTEAIARSLFVEDRLQFLAAFEAYGRPELLGDEWRPWEGPMEDESDAAA
jgi:FAD-dependent urate hydroxylase